MNDHLQGVQHSGTELGLQPHSGHFFCEKNGRRKNAMSVVFVIGPPRSGTTLVLDLLGAHPEVTAHGVDFHDFHHDLTLFRERTEKEDHFRLTSAEATPEIRTRYRERIQELLHNSGARHCVIKISTLSIQVDYIRTLVPEARIVQMVRDARDAAYSMEDLRQELQRSEGRARDLGPAADPFGLWCSKNVEHKLVRACASWSYHVTRSMLDLAFAGPETYLRLRFEDLLESPKQTVNGLLKFVGLGSHTDLEKLFSQISDVPGRERGLGFSTTQSQGPRIGRHRDTMPQELRTVVAPILELPMNLLGYAPDPWPEAETFYEACESLKIDGGLWAKKAKFEALWFQQHYAAFAPARELPSLVEHPEAKLLLVDGAWVGHHQSILDGQGTGFHGWIQKQNRRHSFVDAHAIWPQLAPLLQGEHSLKTLQQRFSRSALLDILEPLIAMGFVAAVL